MKTATTALLASLRAVGIDVQPLGPDTVKVEAPEGALTDDLRARIREHKAELIRALSPPEPLRLTRLLAEDFARADQWASVRMPGVAGVVWMVPTAEDAAWLWAHEGVERGRVFTAGELADMASTGPHSPETWCAVTLAKIALDGTVVEVRQRAEGIAA